MKKNSHLIKIIPIIILVSFLLGAYLNISKNIAEMKRDMVLNVSLVESKVKSLFENNIDRMVGVTAHIGMDTSFQTEDLNHFIENVINKNNIISNIGVFEDMTAVYLYPYEANKTMDHINRL